MLGKIVMGCGTINGSKRSNITQLKLLDELELDPVLTLARAAIYLFSNRGFTTP